MAKPGKMSGKRSTANVRVLCSVNHEMWRVKVVPVFGRARFKWVCACTGHTKMEGK